MTRGILVLVTNDKILHSQEFNGEMYPDDEDYAGYVAFEGIKKITSEEEFAEFLKYFNNEYFEYDNGAEVIDITDEADIFNIVNKKNMFRDTDYTYIKNISKEPLNIVDRYGQGVRVKPNGYITLEFGAYDFEGSINCEDYSEGSEYALLDYQIDICEENGWRVNELSDCEVELSQYSPAGEDYSFVVNIKNFAKEVEDYAEGFDIDEHAINWYGGPGAPSSLRTLLDDAEDIQEMLENLARALRNIK